MNWMKDALGVLEHNGRLRRPREMEPLGAVKAMYQGRETVVFCSNDYLGLRSHPEVVAAAQRAMETSGTGVGASRLVSGNTLLHEKTEMCLARWVGAPAALLGSSGYAVNVGTLAALMGPDDVVFSDALNHASLIDGMRLSRAKIVVVEHCDLKALEKVFRDTPRARRQWFVTESLFSMDGDSPDLKAVRALTEKHGVGLYVDEAHAIGVLGEGRGLCHQVGVVPEVLVGTLGKALGSHGAFVAGDQTLKAFLWNRCRAFVFSTGLGPGPTAAACAAVKLLEQNPERIGRLRKNIARLHSGLDRHGIEHGGRECSPVVPVRFDDDWVVMGLTEALLKEGYFVQGIRPPTVPEGTSRLRITLSAEHTEAMIDGLVEALVRCIGAWQ